ncbi:hypothetical protein EVAR_722_1 [Eumeta japonica]|uniref:Uncharacterized protein n=1 Tax=Eumeta variegata TaxID=151549 RepID=A0A4C1SEP7_EUMVA|nr:hypothetical protein EVAR_722_1 [Eumeta japonica]
MLIMSELTNFILISFKFNYPLCASEITSALSRRSQTSRPEDVVTVQVKSATSPMGRDDGAPRTGSLKRAANKGDGRGTALRPK